MNQSADRPSIERPASVAEIKASAKEAEEQTESFAQKTGERIEKLPTQSIAYAWEFFIPSTLRRTLMTLFMILNAATIILLIVLLFSPDARSNSELTEKILFNLAAVIILPLLAMSVGYYIGLRSAARPKTTQAERIVLPLLGGFYIGRNEDAISKPGGKPSESVATPDRT